MAGAAEWCDSWWLVSHRETPDVPAGRFRLLLEIGSRQWGGSEWDLDINLGAFDIDTLTYDDAISWTINPHRAANVEDDTDDAVIQTLVDEPWQHTRTELALRVKGNTQKTRASISRLESQQRIRRASLRRPEGGGKRIVTRDLYAMTSEPLPEKTP